MAKLTKQQATELATVLSNLERAVAYLKQDKVIGIAQTVRYPLGNSYTINNPVCEGPHSIQVVNKDIGSDLVLLYRAEQDLKVFLEVND